MFGKIFASMYDGSLRTRSPWQALVTFQQMIVLANKEGEVDMTAEAIAFRTGIPLEIITVGIAALELPDPDSRSPGEEGRRIVRLDEGRTWGWRIVNYEHYRKMRSLEERREYMRQLMQDKRAAAKQAVSIVSHPLAVVSNVSPCSKQYAGSSKQMHNNKRKHLTDDADASPSPGDSDDLFPPDEMPAPRKTARAKPKSPPQFAGFPQALCAELHAMWESELGGVDFARFRKAIGPLFRLPEAERPPAAATNDELKRALKLYTLVALSGKQAPFAASPDYAGARLAAIARLYRDTTNDSEQRLDGAQNIVHGQQPQRFTA